MVKRITSAGAALAEAQKTAALSDALECEVNGLEMQWEKLIGDWKAAKKPHEKVLRNIDSKYQRKIFSFRVTLLQAKEKLRLIKSKTHYGQRRS